MSSLMVSFCEALSCYMMSCGITPFPRNRLSHDMPQSLTDRRLNKGSLCPERGRFQLHLCSALHCCPLMTVSWEGNGNTQIQGRKEGSTSHLDPSAFGEHLLCSPAAARVHWSFRLHPEQKTWLVWVGLCPATCKHVPVVLCLSACLTLNFACFFPPYTVCLEENFLLKSLPFSSL